VIRPCPGAFRRGTAGFRTRVTADGSAGPTGTDRSVAGLGLYRLWVRGACPRAHPQPDLPGVNGVLKRCRPQGLPDRKAGNSCTCVRLEHPGRGHRPCHSATLPLASRGPKPPASARPAHGGRFAPAGPGAGLPVCEEPSRMGRGNEGRVSFSRPEERKHPHRFNGRGYRPCHSATLPLASRGPKPPASARPARRALPARRVGRWPLPLPDPPICGAPSRAGGGNAGRVSCSRTGRAKAPSPLQWQGPSPLPQRHSGIRTSRGPKAPGQRPPRPRRALCPRRVGRWPFVVPGPAGLQGTVARGRGNAMRFLLPPERAKVS